MEACRASQRARGSSRDGPAAPDVGGHWLVPLPPRPLVPHTSSRPWRPPQSPGLKLLVRAAKRPSASTRRFPTPPPVSLRARFLSLLSFSSSPSFAIVAQLSFLADLFLSFKVVLLFLQPFRYPSLLSGPVTFFRLFQRRPLSTSDDPYSLELEITNRLILTNSRFGLQSFTYLRSTLFFLRHLQSFSTRSFLLSFLAHASRSLNTEAPPSIVDAHSAIAV